MTQIGLKRTEEDEGYYHGPMVGYTTEELERFIGQAVLDLFDQSDLQIVWKPKD